MNLAPARWIWLPSQRTLSNTFVLFRRQFRLETLPQKVTGWLTADSRYRLTVNGQRVQWGPGPCDPRELEVDPCDLTAYLHTGLNVIGIEVLFYGHGEGAWVTGKPGVIAQFNLSYSNGEQQQLVTDESWLSLLDRAHAPGQYQRWFLRSLQEDFDARKHPAGWDTPAYQPDKRWLAAMPIEAASDKPIVSGPYKSYTTDQSFEPADCLLRPREISLLQELPIPALQLADAGRVHWQRDPLDWFEMRVPQSFTIERDAHVVSETEATVWQLLPQSDPHSALYLTFEWSEQLVGWPYFTIEAPAGTIIELMTQESHALERTLWLDSHFYCWTRFTCREGLNTFEPFDFESLRWLQLHIRNTQGGPVRVSQVGIRRRLYPWPGQPQVTCAEPALQRLFDASLNTLYNSAQETVVDGMGRERQQYSGDAGHQHHAIRALLDGQAISRRYLLTYSKGQTLDGYYLDCWPGYDRLARLIQRQIQGTPWGPLVDHSVGFVFDNWHHYLETGDLATVKAVYPGLKRFVHYLETIRDEHGLLKVDGLGVPTVWIDHDAYLQQRHKQCAFNLYASAMLLHALLPLSQALADTEAQPWLSSLGQDLLTCTIHRYWSEQDATFINNLPWLQEEGGGKRYCDRSLATALLFAQSPHQQQANVLKLLVDSPLELGISFPANAGWRYQALARHGHVAMVLKDFRERWATMDSVLLNNTLQEMWEVPSDSTAQWSHCPVSPLFLLSMDIAGIRPTSPAYQSYEIQPRLGDLPGLDLTVYSPSGPIEFHSRMEAGWHHLSLNLPATGDGVLVLPVAAQIEGNFTVIEHDAKEQRISLKGRQQWSLSLPVGAVDNAP